VVSWGFWNTQNWQFFDINNSNTGNQQLFESLIFQILWARHLINCRDNKKILWWFFWKDYPLSQSTYAKLGSSFLGVGIKKSKKGQRQTQVWLWTAWTNQKVTGPWRCREPTAEIKTSGNPVWTRHECFNWDWSVVVMAWQELQILINHLGNIPKKEESRTQFQHLEKRVHAILQDKRWHKPSRTHQISTQPGWAQVTKHLPSKFPNGAQDVWSCENISPSKFSYLLFFFNATHKTMHLLYKVHNQVHIFSWLIYVKLN
jgi:hypothetical protein